MTDVEIPVGLGREAETRKMLGYLQVLLVDCLGVALLFNASRPYL